MLSFNTEFLLCYMLKSWYMTNIKVNSAFHPSGVGKSSTGLHGWGLGAARLPVSGGR